MLIKKTSNPQLLGSKDLNLKTNVVCGYLYASRTL